MSQLAIDCARRWLGTPFLAGASVQGTGCDCAGLMEGVARELGAVSPTRETMGDDILAAAFAFLVPSDATAAGTLILLSRDPGGVPVHAALVTDTNTLIHAHWSAGVIENRFGTWFARRTTHIFSWPNTHPDKDL
jgi:NlpC/P60 family putative phage cell wall peptidase